MTDQLPTYSVVVSREDGLWVADVHGLPAGATDVEKFEDLEPAVVDLIASLCDIEPGSFWIDWQYQLGSEDLTVLIKHLREWEALAEQAAQRRDAARKTLVDAMHLSGLSYREIADVIGVSHQRVHQLVSADLRADTGRDHSPDLIMIDSDVLVSYFEVKVAERWRNSARSSRNRWLHGMASDGKPTPFESVLTALLVTVRQERPDSRRDILSTAASVLEETAADNEFLRSPGGLDRR